MYLILIFIGEESVECQLFCVAEGQNFFHKLADKVIDGTPCRQDTRDVCVNGVCRVGNWNTM